MAVNAIMYIGRVPASSAGQVPGSVPARGRVIPKTLKKWYQWFPCSTLNIERETLALSKFSNCKIANIPSLRAL